MRFPPATVVPQPPRALLPPRYIVLPRPRTVILPARVALQHTTAVLCCAEAGSHLRFSGLSFLTLSPDGPLVRDDSPPALLSCSCSSRHRACAWRASIAKMLVCPRAAAEGVECSYAGALWSIQPNCSSATRWTVTRSWAACCSCASYSAAARV